MQRDNVFSYVDDNAAVKNFMAGVYAWMAIGVAVSGLVAFFTAQNRQLLYSIQNGIWLLFIVEIGLVIFLSRKIMTMDAAKGAFFYLLYSAINGLTLSFIFLAYTATSITTVFFITAGMFGATSLWGFVTKRNLSTWGRVLFMALIGLIIASVVNWFLKSAMMYYLISYAGVAIFTALTAYDTQKIKNYYHQMSSGSSEGVKRLAILGALILYIDFINLFLFLLRLFGRRD